MVEQVITTKPNNTLSITEDSNAIVARSRSNFSSAFLFLPKEKRTAICRVYAFFRVIDDVVDEEPNPLRQRELIDLWKQELNRCYEGVTIVPLLKELKESIDRFQIPQEYFLKLIEGCEMDINKKRYETFEELYQYCYRVASMVGLVCMKIFEYKSSTSEEAAINLGIALQLTNIIRDVGVDLDKGRIYLPLEDLKTFNISEADLRSKDDSEKFKALMDFEYKRAMTYYEKGTLEFKKDPTNRLLAAKIMAVVYSRILKKIKKKNFPVLHRRIGLKFYQKLAILAQLLIFS